MEWLMAIGIIEALIGMIYGAACADDKINNGFTLKENLLPTKYGTLFLAIIFLPVLVSACITYVIAMGMYNMFKWSGKHIGRKLIKLWKKPLW